MAREKGSDVKEVTEIFWPLNSLFIFSICFCLSPQSSDGYSKAFLLYSSYTVHSFLSLTESKVSVQRLRLTAEILNIPCILLDSEFIVFIL